MTPGYPLALSLAVSMAVLGSAPQDPLVAIQYLASVLGAYLLVIAAVLVGYPLVRRYALRGA